MFDIDDETYPPNVLSVPRNMFDEVVVRFTANTGCDKPTAQRAVKAYLMASAAVMLVHLSKMTPLEMKGVIRRGEQPERLD